MLERIKKTKISTEATPGSEVRDCIDEAIELALAADTPVSLNHNGKVFLANPYDIRKIVIDSGKVS
jgi:hypothetical protein